MGTSSSLYTVDLHIHSALSPCADDTMTPLAIVNRAKEVGLSVIALTDHNSILNCPAIMGYSTPETSNHPRDGTADHRGSPFYLSFWQPGAGNRVATLRDSTATAPAK